MNYTCKGIIEHGTLEHILALSGAYWEQVTLFGRIMSIFQKKKNDQNTPKIVILKLSLHEKKVEKYFSSIWNKA